MKDLTFRNYGDEIEYDTDEEYFDVENFYKYVKSSKELPLSKIDWTKLGEQDLDDY